MVGEGNYVFLGHGAEPVDLAGGVLPVYAADEGVNIFLSPGGVALQRTHFAELDVVDGGLDEGLVEVSALELGHFGKGEVPEFLKGLSLLRIGDERKSAVVGHTDG